MLTQPGTADSDKQDQRGAPWSLTGCQGHSDTQMPRSGDKGSDTQASRSGDTGSDTQVPESGAQVGSDTQEPRSGAQVVTHMCLDRGHKQ